MGAGIALLIGFPVIKWPVMVALLAALRFDAVRAAYTWFLLSICGYLGVSTALMIPVQLLQALLPADASNSVILPILYFALFPVLLIALDAWLVGRQARRKFYRNADDVLPRRAAWGISIAGNLLPVVPASVLMLAA